MPIKKALVLILLFALLAQPLFLRAFETDQFSLPPVPLADIGDEFTDFIVENIEKALKNVNDEIKKNQDCLNNSKQRNCAAPDVLKNRLQFLRSRGAVAREIYKILGKGKPFTLSSSWVESHDFKSQPARFKPSAFKSIFVLFPTDYIRFSSTVKMFGAEFGTDKIAHIFEQGYEYYKLYEDEIAKGATADEALKKVVRRGQKSERTYYGTLVSGVYSNADLYANYTGMMFYKNLVEANSEDAEVFVLTEGYWRLNPNFARKNLLRPYLSDGLSEAFNPSIYIRPINFYARRVLKRNCGKWKEKYPNFTKADFEKILRKNELYKNRDYGFKRSDKFVTVGATCFAD